MINKDFILGYGAGKANGGPKISIEPLSVDANGEYTAPEGTAYSPVEVDVPNTYVAEDEGKVVSEGALVSQTSMSVTQNGVVDTTLVNSVDVDVDSADAVLSPHTSAYINTTYSGDIRSNCFISHPTLSEVTFEKCRNIGSYAFSGCSKLTTASFQECTIVLSGAFDTCRSLTTISFPKATKIGSRAFAACRSLTAVYFPECLQISQNAFYLCENLSEAIFPACAIIGSSAFLSCYKLEKAYFPSCVSISRSAFYSLSALSDITFTNCKNIQSDAFYSCGFSVASFPMASQIYGGAFASNSNLMSLYLLGSSIVNLVGNPFAYTPLWKDWTGSEFGAVYVPASLVEAYQSATNWVYAKNIVGLTDEEIAAL